MVNDKKAFFKENSSYSDKHNISNLGVISYILDIYNKHIAQG